MTNTAETIGKYIIRRSMGEGAMGVVLEGFDPHIERRVAIKCLHPHLIAGDPDGQFLQRFKQEAQAAARCSHPNIVTILEYGEHENAPYIVMEYIDGTNLQDLLESKRVKHLKNVLSFVGQILKALHIAHDQGVIHRDIKPANVIVMNNGAIKLADFGIARVPVDNNLTQVGVAIGTPRYMSPEQAMALPTDHRADLYALTMLFAQMLTELKLESSIQSDVFPEIAGLAKNHYINNEVQVPKAFIPIVIKGLALDPEQRIQSAKEYLARLKSAVNALKSKSVNTSSSDQITAIRPARNAPETTLQIDPLEIESLQTILSDYIGPIAHKIVQSESNQFREPSALARAVSSEIVDKSERDAFIREWENKTGQRAVSSTRSGGDEAIDSRSANSTPYLSDTVRQDLEKSFARFVGPMAGRLIKMHQGKCQNFATLIDQLVEEIPDDEDRLAFADQWISQ